MALTELQYMEMSRLELLTGMQALSIYIFVRLDEGQTEDNNFEAMLLAVVTVCFWVPGFSAGQVR